MAKKRFDYFDYFQDVGAIISEGATHLNETLHNYTTDGLQERLDALHEIEHRADCAKHDMIKNLAHEFITPIEREDIVTLAQDLDNVVDYLEDVLLRIYMFNVSAIKEDALAFSDVIVECVKNLNVALSEFKNFKRSETLKDAIVAVNHYESEGDKILVKGVRNLSVSGCSDRELYIWTDIYEHLEICLDACEDITDIIEEVIMKNS